MKRFLGERMQGTQPLPAPKTLDGDTVKLEVGGERLEPAYTDAHFPGDAWEWLPKQAAQAESDVQR